MMHETCSHRDLFASCEGVAVVEVEWKQWGRQVYCAEHEALYTSLRGRCGGKKTPLNIS